MVHTMAGFFSRQHITKFLEAWVKLALGRPCPACGSLHRSGGSEYKVQAPIPTFQVSRAAGCKTCRMALDAIDAFEPGWVTAHASGGSITLLLSQESHPLGMQLRENAGSAREFTYLGVYLAADNPIIPRAQLKGPCAYSLDIIPDARSDEAFSRVSQWLGDCLSHHDNCSASTKEHFMPTRLLGLGLVAEEGRALLLATSGLEPDRYACLSYCWGSDLEGVVTTVAANRATHQTSGIPVAALPRTVQDAVLVCLKLGIRYLWVDALCIVQDDAEDWARESVRMCDIYGSSHITIAAHGAASCKDGFLGEQGYGRRSWQRAFPTRYGSAFPDANPAKMLLRVGQEASVTSPLSTRGWTLQECILPRRIIHYTAQELVWECNSQHFCECGHIEGLRRGGPLVMEKTQVRQVEIARDGQRVARMRTPAVDSWMQLVERYTDRRLTYVSDRLVAVAGLAQWIREQSGEGMDPEMYLAGVFRPSLPRHLLWMVKAWKTPRLPNQPDVAPPRPVPPRAPSWSWASVDSHIEYTGEAFGDSEETYVRVHHDKSFCVPVPGGPAHALRGELVLEGPTVPVKLVTVESPRIAWGDQRNDSWMGRATYAWSVSGARNQIACDVARDPGLAVGDEGRECWSTEEHRCEACEAGAWPVGGENCVLKLSAYYLDPADRVPPVGYFLVLQKSETTPGAWERIGLGEVKLGKLDDPRTEWELFEQAEVREIRLV
ncbi:heterokaryon incompatibility protein-domain-containing protein [Lasiosphaeris hirsuta]|uniref:Heterokaryon incompatibility protein-domain-containing protein n=1 Tax=Lasiosphaeris hirsuta TaxID=260670 RepID=A0AA40A3C1_9PEZI|nr:heterokaryon incompatibility protein-domain-containing protein [Lasiosphaeris hirsuta]